jgi:uncharacterized delta-60 repeat protein
VIVYFILAILAQPTDLAFGAISKVQDIGTANSKSAGTTLSVIVSGGGVIAGHSIVVTFAMDDNSGSVTCSDTAGNTYTVDEDVTNAGEVRTVIISSHNVSALSGGGTITVTHPSVTARAMSVAEFSGLAATSTFDQKQSGTGNSASPSSGATPTTTVANELLIGAIGAEGPLGDSFTKGTLWDAALARDGTTGQGAASNITINPEYWVVSATGNYTADGTITSRDWAAAIATYKADPSIITAGASGNQTASMAIPSSSQYVGGAFTFVRDSGTANINQIILSETNTVEADINLSNVALYYETAGTCSYDGDESLFGTASSFDGSDMVTISDFAGGTVTYNSGGTQTDWPYAITIDTSGNIYVAGHQFTNGQDWAVRKYTANADLDTAWGNSGMVTYNSGGTQQDSTRAITIDSSNNIYVAGFQQTNGRDWAVRKYDASGNLDTTWGSSGMVTYNSGGTQFDYARAITIDSTKAIYVAGDQATNGRDWAVRKYDESGNLDTSWGTNGMVTYNSGGTQNDYAYAITIDASDNIYVAGSQQTNGNDLAVRKYDANGNLDTTWGNSGMVTYNSGGTQNDYAYAITIDASDNIYVAGSQQTNGNDLAVRKYDANGNLDTTWGNSGMVTYNSGGTQNDYAYAITIDASDNIYVAGRQQTNGNDWAVRKYDANGNLDTSWGTSGMVTYNSGGTQFDGAYAITIDASNNVYVTGYQQTNGYDWAVRKYISTGDLSQSMPVGTSQVCVYVVLDVLAGAINGDLLDFEITDPSSDVTVDSGSVNPATAVAISGTTTLSGTACSGTFSYQRLLTIDKDQVGVDNKSWVFDRFSGPYQLIWQLVKERFQRWKYIQIRWLGYYLQRI